VKSLEKIQRDRGGGIEWGEAKNHRKEGLAGGTVSLLKIWEEGEGILYRSTCAGKGKRGDRQEEHRKKKKKGNTWAGEGNK